jgi:hypothetical protein
MDEMDELDRFIEKLTPEELEDKMYVVDKSKEIGELLSVKMIEIVDNNGYDDLVLVLATAIALKLMILEVEDRGVLEDETPKSFVENILVPFLLDQKSKILKDK